MKKINCNKLKITVNFELKHIWAIHYLLNIPICMKKNTKYVQQINNNCVIENTHT